MKDWISHFMDVARLMASRSKDPSEQIGAVIFDKQRRLLGSGYNGFPRGVLDLPERYDDKETKKKLVVHAETNAILNSHLDLRGATLVSTKFPCSECAKLIIQCGITAVVSPLPHENKLEDSAYVRLMFQEACVHYREES